MKGQSYHRWQPDAPISNKHGNDETIVFLVNLFRQITLVTDTVSSAGHGGSPRHEALGVP